ncbi:hypothetical protein ACRAWF_10045 [Streptomyces sp. L7]
MRSAGRGASTRCAEDKAKKEEDPTAPPRPAADRAGPAQGHRPGPARALIGRRSPEPQALERGSSQPSAEPALPTGEPPPVRTRPSLQPVRGASDPITVDLTAEDDTMALPRLDSLERKLKDLEQQFG